MFLVQKRYSTTENDKTAKKEALKSAGVKVAETITKIGEAMKISMGVS